MELMLVILSVYAIFFGICFIISCTDRVNYQQWPDGEQILSRLTRMVTFGRKR